MACHLKDLLDQESDLSRALLPVKRDKLRVLELGTGCGIVGIALAQVFPEVDVLLTDLPEADEIVDRNLKQVTTAEGSSLRFEAFDWDDELPVDVQASSGHALDLVLAADCTYNPDSR